MHANLARRAFDHSRRATRTASPSVYETEPVGGIVQDEFWNVVMEVTTDASADELLARARWAEHDAHRTREVRWGPRTLDVDVLLVGDEVRSDPELTVPHPRMHERAFVLRPLRELAPDLVSERAIGWRRSGMS